MSVLDPPEPELLVVVSCHVDSENQTWALFKSGKCSLLLSLFLALEYIF